MRTFSFGAMRLCVSFDMQFEDDTFNIPWYASMESTFNIMLMNNIVSHDFQYYFNYHCTYWKFLRGLHWKWLMLAHILEWTNYSRNYKYYWRSLFLDYLVNTRALLILCTNHKLKLIKGECAIIWPCCNTNTI